MLREGTGHAWIQTQVPLYEREKWAHSGSLEGPNKCSESAPSPVLPSIHFSIPKNLQQLAVVSAIPVYVPGPQWVA